MWQWHTALHIYTQPLTRIHTHTHFTLEQFSFSKWKGEKKHTFTQLFKFRQAYTSWIDLISVEKKLMEWMSHLYCSLSYKYAKTKWKEMKRKQLVRKCEPVVLDRNYFYSGLMMLEILNFQKGRKSRWNLLKSMFTAWLCSKLTIAHITSGLSFHWLALCIFHSTGNNGIQYCICFVQSYEKMPMEHIIATVHR